MLPNRFVPLLLIVPLALAQQQPQGVVGGIVGSGGNFSGPTMIYPGNAIPVRDPNGQMVNPQGQRPNFTMDCSADGTVVNAISGEPIPRARVSFTNGFGVTADSAGRFQATNIMCGPVVASASKPGFLQAFMTNGNRRVMTPPTILPAGGAAHDLRVSLTPQSVIVGIVTDDQGDPVMNARVSVYTSRVQQGKRQFQMGAGAMSNDLGEFRIPGLAGGKYIVCAQPNMDVAGMDTRSNLAPGERCYAGPVEGGMASTFELPAGREVRVQLNLPMVTSVHVRGTVTGLQTKSRGVAISLMRRGVLGGAANRNAPPGPDGRFDIRGVTPGSYTLGADYWEDNKRFTARIPLDVGNNDVENVTVTLTQGFAINGTLRIESKNPSTAPPPRQQFNIVLRPSEPMAGGGRLVWNPDGASFTLADMSAGTYRLEAFGGGNFFIKRAMYNGRDISREDVTITQPGGAIELVVSDDGGSVEGQVQSRDGTPSQATVMLLEDGRTPRMSAADATGTFRIPSLAPGSYTAYAWDDVTQVEFADADWMRRNAEGVKVVVEAGQAARVTLNRKELLPQQ